MSTIRTTNDPLLDTQIVPLEQPSNGVLYNRDMLIGYARVSTVDQNLDLQRDALLKAGCERIFEEKKSGKARTSRPEFDAALAFLRSEDILVVWKLDRLGRSLVEMMRTLDTLRKDGVRFQSLTEHFDSDTAHGRFAL